MKNFNVWNDFEQKIYYNKKLFSRECEILNTE